MNTNNMIFDGSSYSPKQDRKRLTSQYSRVMDVMDDGEWRTLSQISKQAKAPEASVSARIRDARKPRFGCHKVECRRVAEGMGQHEYRLIKLQ